jgi:microcompartment protein CcmL/EutN
MSNSVGIIETEGLVGAIEAADAAVKSANVKLIGYERARGKGLTAVKVTGDVGAVQAAVEAGAAAAARIIGADKVYTLLIPRPANDLDMMIRNEDTVGYAKTPNMAPSPGAEAPRAKPETPEAASPPAGQPVKPAEPKSAPPVGKPPKPAAPQPKTAKPRRKK